MITFLIILAQVLWRALVIAAIVGALIFATAIVTAPLWFR